MATKSGSVPQSTKPTKKRADTTASRASATSGLADDDLAVPRPRLTRRSPALRLFLVIAALFTAWHVFASFLWIAPVSPLREVVPKGMLQAYMLPMFGQSWSVFAPEPINGSYQLSVRAVVKDGAQEKTTDWVDATAVELSMLQYNPFPPRAGIQAAQLASEVKGAFDGMTADHRVIAGLNYYEADWEERMQQKLESYGREDLADAFVEKDHMATAYATQVANAVWETPWNASSIGSSGRT